MSSIEEQYRGLLGSLLHNSNKKADRTGTGTHSIFGKQIRHDMSEGFPLLTTKKMAVKTMMTELKWFLKGDTNIKYLVDNNCHIWNGDAYKAYTFLGLPFNIASYAALLCLIAEEVDMIPDQLIGNLGDVHLYSNHVDQAMEQISREIYDLPTVSFKNVNILDGEFDYEVHDYKYHPSIKAPLSN